MERTTKRNVPARRLAALVALPLALAVSACLPEGVQVPQSELSGLLERKSGRIAFLGVDGNIYTIDQGGGDEVQVTTDAFSDASRYLTYNMPIWSPDSRALAFVSYAGPRGEVPETVSLYTAEPGNGEPVQAHSGADFLVYWNWAPDSQHVGFIAETPSNSLALHVVPPHGASSLVDVGSPYYWAWSPDGSAVLAHAGGTASAQGRLALLQLGEEVVEYGYDVRPAVFKAPAFSPDGSQVLVAGHTEDSKTALMLTDALGNNPRPLAEFAGHVAFVWSPNGQRIAYLEAPDANPGTPGKLTVLDPSGRRDPVTVDEEVYAFFWSPDSRSLAYFIEDPLDDEAAGEPTPAPDGEAPAAPEDEEAFIWGLRVADANSGNSRHIAQFLTTERFLQVIPYFDQYHQSLNIWSPDSKNLVVSAYRNDGTPGIWVVAASGNLQPRYIADGWVGFWSPR